MTPSQATGGRARGLTLIEAVVSLSILLIGMVGTFHLQIFGVTSDAGGRAHTQALQVARELLVALEQLGPEDVRIKENFSGGDNPPSGFGRLLGSSGTYTPYSDSLGLQGVKPDAEYISASITDPLDPSLPRFQRRWTAWAPTGPITGNSSKLLAVSVIWRERGLTAQREVVLYGQVINPAAVTAYANFYR